MKIVIHSRATLSGGRASLSGKGASHHRDGISCSGGRPSLSGKGAFYSSVVRKELLLSKRREESSTNRLNIIPLVLFAMTFLLRCSFSRVS